MPFILLAEKIGGICNFSPVKLLEIFFKMLSSKAGVGNSLSISVSKSNEGVVDPNLISPVYSLDSFINWSIIFNEKFELYHFIGASFILSGIYLSNRKANA